LGEAAGTEQIEGVPEAIMMAIILEWRKTEWEV
jgi:hypothetical protein